MQIEVGGLYETKCGHHVFITHKTQNGYDGLLNSQKEWLVFSWDNEGNAAFGNARNIVCHGKRDDLFPLSVDDVPPGSVFKGSPQTKGWTNPVSVSANGVSFDNNHTTSWQELMNYMIRRPDGNWEPCMK